MGLGDFLRRLFGGKPALPSSPPPIGRAPTRAPVPQTSWPSASPVQGAPPPLPSAPARTPQRQREVTLDLDVVQFQPLSTDDVRAQAAGQKFTGFWEFGRRDRIPSAADPRTKLIDQAMVGQGLITPEELTGIHAVGERMDELRPQIAGAHVLAERAVQADREARQRIRAEKKAAAERRRQEHAARVARNRATDIVFLGRGVSAGLADRRSNLERLQAQGLPPLSTPADVAAALGVTVPRLRWLAFHAEASTVCHYVHFLIPKKSGGERTLSAPRKNLAAAQRWVLDNVLSKLPAHAAAHGFVPGRSILTNAAPHVGSFVVVNCDLTDFFPSVTVHRVIGCFRHLGYSPAVATVLALLVTESPRRKVLFHDKPWYVATAPRGLPQGACTSPALSNMISRRLDSRLTGIATKLGWTYTRYADDLTFSSKAPSDRTGYLLARIRHITQDEGFAVNEKKTRVLKRAARQTVTGVVTNEKPAASRNVRRRMRAILHNAGKTGLGAQNRKNDAQFAASLGGMIEYIGMLNPKHAEPLREALGRLRR